VRRHQGIATAKTADEPIDRALNRKNQDVRRYLH
jgi:hypothetical protein